VGSVISATCMSEGFSKCDRRLVNMHEAIGNVGSVLSPNACVTRLCARLVSDRGVVGTCDSYTQSLWLPGVMFGR
jgi:hypothetical protein